MRSIPRILFVSMLAGSLGGCGTASYLVNPEPYLRDSGPKLSAPNPGEKGTFTVKTCFYGSGEDKRRPEFGAKVDLKTESVDASPFVKIDKKPGAKRKRYWGFSPARFPVNGRVWYPDGPGPFPLALIVHGNHEMKEYSDPGYAYLGELLASRGFILASVDENFLNGELGGENDARAWMLLQHLKAWQKWNQTEGNVFFKKVDMDNIALMGHSRGGESVAHAAAFNRLSHYPDDANIAFDFGFSIKSIIAIAPSDEQYRPAGKPTPLENINYLLLHGGHDADVFIFMGARQYQRLRLTEPGWFKTSLYIYRANHSRFNTAWGLQEMSKYPFGWIQNVKPVLPSEDQRRIAEVYISAFLESTLRNKTEYLPMFRDHYLARDWVPKEIYVTRYADASVAPVADFEEDVDVTTGSEPGVGLKASGLTVWKEARLRFRDIKGESRENGDAASIENNAVYLGWGRSEEHATDAPSYSIKFPKGFAVERKLDKEIRLRFSLGTTEDSPDKPDYVPRTDKTKQDLKAEKQRKKEKEERAKTDKEARKGEDEKPLDISIEIVTEDGTRESLPVSQFAPIYPPLKARLAIWKWIERKYMGSDTKASDRIFQDYEIPLAAFSEPGKEIDPAKISEVRWVFDRSKSGMVILDDVGFSRP